MMSGRSRLFPTVRSLVRSPNGRLLPGALHSFDKCNVLQQGGVLEC